MIDIEKIRLVMSIVSRQESIGDLCDLIGMDLTYLVYEKLSLMSKEELKELEKLIITG